ncbi:DoxX family protein [Actinocorallia sp. API 0066]|uniref:DoxX family protein n=1 Tax=Actinocorallia sp. API 0066 TaxID=2896846 RepID=UPI001E3EABF8|nr:DoxX family protein [Actinocorallia sp. API 0066]MCD0453369.1 DoxX family protein [Actinocorallia sp. API 0066]
MQRSRLFDTAALLARTAVGVVFVAHGWLKIEDGITATAVEFAALGVPLAKAAAVYATFAELLGGVALIAGLGLPVAGTVLFLDMAGAFAFVHVTEGLTAPEGFELVIVLGMASLLFAAGGGGNLTLDHALRVRRTRGEELRDFLPPDDDGGAPPYLPAAREPAPEVEGHTGPDPADRFTPEATVPDGVTAPEAAPGDVVVARGRARRTRQEKDAK